jgi:hypothetical protein
MCASRCAQLRDTVGPLIAPTRAAVSDVHSRDYRDAIYNRGPNDERCNRLLESQHPGTGRTGLGLAAQRFDIEHFGKTRSCCDQALLQH